MIYGTFVRSTPLKIIECANRKPPSTEGKGKGMNELTRSQKDHQAIKEYRSCCTYSGKLEFDPNSVCLKHK